MTLRAKVSVVIKSLLDRVQAKKVVRLVGWVAWLVDWCMSGMAEKLREACVRGEAERVARFLSEGIKPLPDENGRSPLLLAAALGHTEVCNALLLHETEVNAADSTWKNIPKFVEFVQLYDK
ncbi:hypothetical protein M0802_004725 [Mischocyttarus mexicanus]|nr:hypothetical protein M0802_004725 [Mischocyttarus mexicanus]